NVGKRILTSVDPNNFAPRVGFAYSLLESGRLVVRGGYGIFYSRPSAAYIGISINAPPRYTIRRSPTGATVPLAHPFSSLPTAQVITTTPPAAANVALRAPYQGVEVGGFLQIQSTAQSTYNSLQMSLTRRLSKGLQLLASYTYAKSIDNASGGSDSTGEVRDTINIAGNQLDNRANRGVSDFDRTHRFVLSYLWDLPRPAFAARSTVGKL